MKTFKLILIMSSFTFGACETLSNLRPELTTEADIEAALETQFTEIPNSWQSAQARIGDVEIGWIDKLGDPVLSALVDEAIISAARFSH